VFGYEADFEFYCTLYTLSPAIFSLLRFNRFVLSIIPPVFLAHLILASEGPLLQELETGCGKDIAAAGKVEDVAAADTLKEVAACSVTVHVQDVAAADSVKDVALFVKELAALFESTLSMPFNPSRITCSLLSTRASDVPQSPQSVRECSPLSNRV
jgi:hypothetical protein